MPSRRPHFCIFGDSHFACLKQAIKDGLVDVPDIDLEFWGNIGHRFRRIGWRNERIEGLDDFTTHRFAKLNERQRTYLSADEFDAILFAGCRIPIQDVFAELFDRRSDEAGALSAGLERRVIRDALEKRMPYVFAQRMAAQQHAQIIVAPISFDIAPDDGAAAEIDPADAKRRRVQIWDRFADVLAEDGITLLPQPEETVSQGYFTSAYYASAAYASRGDRTHKNGKYGALVLEHFFEMAKDLELPRSGTQHLQSV